MHPSATHQNMLRKCIEHTTGDVLELGCGEHSTPFIAQLLGSSRYVSLTGRLHVRMDSMKEWADRYEAVYVRDWFGYQMKLDGRFSVALVDCHPMASRGPLVELIRPWVDYIVCHDTEPTWWRAYGWHHVKPFKHKHVDRYMDARRGVWIDTTVWSELDLGFLTQ